MVDARNKSHDKQVLSIETHDWTNDQSVSDNIPTVGLLYL